MPASWGLLREGEKCYMKITRLETLRLAEFPNLVWLRVHTDQGLTGVGETSYAAQSVEAYLHEYVAPRVLGVRPGAVGPLRQGGEPAAVPDPRRRQPRARAHLQHVRRLPLHPRRR